MDGRVAGDWKRVEVEVEIKSQPRKTARKKLVADSPSLMNVAAAVICCQSKTGYAGRILEESKSLTLAVTRLNQSN